MPIRAARSSRHARLLMTGLLVVAGSTRGQPASEPPCPAPFASIAAPRDDRIAGILDARRWTNPYVMVSADGYELILPGHPRDDRRLGPAGLRKRLVDLPANAWPLGRVVAGSRNLPGPRRDDRSIVAQRLVDLRTLLGKLCVRFDQWPSA